jgi:formamidopyrimidine-DNA glycosylase
MPELPEVTTTAQKLNECLPGLKITKVWTSYNSSYFKGKNQIKDPNYFKKFCKNVSGHKIESVTRIGKNVLINISGPQTILIHMKMTGHLLFGKYKKFPADKQSKRPEEQSNYWRTTETGPLQDQFNHYIRLVFELSNKKHLVLSDARKFAKVTLIPDGDIKKFKDTAEIGPDPIMDKLSNSDFEKILNTKPNGRIKNVLMDQTLIAGIGNIYSDEALWMSGIHPEISPKNMTSDEMKKLLKNIKKVLKKGIDFGGDSMSDYRQPDGTRGDFQNHHQVYRKKGSKCTWKNPETGNTCPGIIIRKVVGGRSAHFCDTHQKI